MNPHRTVRTAPMKQYSAGPAAGFISSTGRTADCWASQKNSSGRRSAPFDAIERNRLLIGAAQPSHREFDVAVGQFAPAFDSAHVGGLGIAGEEVARLGPRLVARQGGGFAQISVVQLPPAGHAVDEIARAKGHVATPAQTTTSSI